MNSPLLNIRSGHMRSILFSSKRYFIYFMSGDNSVILDTNLCEFRHCANILSDLKKLFIRQALLCNYLVINSYKVHLLEI